MPSVLKILLGVDDWRFLKSGDFEAHGGRGEFVFTSDPDTAMKFTDTSAALEYWRTASKTTPLRDDGMPNRPLTAYSVEIASVSTRYRSPDGTTAWDIDEMSAACTRGDFGPPLVLPMEAMPPPDYDSGNLDRDKIDAIKLSKEALDSPCIAIAAEEPGHIRLFCEGNHRLTARYELGLSTILFYLVPAAEEKRFRVDEPRSALTQT